MFQTEESTKFREKFFGVSFEEILNYPFNEVLFPVGIRSSSSEIEQPIRTTSVVYKC